MIADLLNSSFIKNPKISECGSNQRIEKSITMEEFNECVMELKQKQKERLDKCEKVGPDWRCEKCGSSLWKSEVRFQIVDSSKKEPTGNITRMEKVWYCIKCETPPPLVSPVGVIQPQSNG